MTEGDGIELVEQTRRLAEAQVEMNKTLREISKWLDSINSHLSSIAETLSTRGFGGSS